MAKSRETYNKKSKDQARQKQKQDKARKMEERKQNAQKGKSLEDMMAYVDEDGNITNTPPDPSKRKVINAEDIVIGVPQGNERIEEARTGVINFYNEEKGFGFIAEGNGRERIFFHASQLQEPVKLNDKVQYETQNGDRGLVAVEIRKTN